MMPSVGCQIQRRWRAGETLPYALFISSCSGSNSGGHPQNSLDPTTKSLLEQLHKAQATVAAQQQLLQAQVTRGCYLEPAMWLCAQEGFGAAQNFYGF